MSLEATIAANTAAVKEQSSLLQQLIARLTSGSVTETVAIGDVSRTVTIAGGADAPPQPTSEAGNEVLNPASDKTQVIPKEVVEQARPQAEATADAQTAAASAQTASSEKPTESPAAGAVLPLETLQGTISKKAATHRAEVVATLLSFGAKRGGEVKEADRAACNAKLLEIGA